MNRYPFQSKTPVLGICAFSGTGKTTLLTRLIPLLKAQGIRLAVIKHAHHKFEVDQPGKDSYKIRKSGADQMLISSAKRWVLMTELNNQAEADLPRLIALLDHDHLDLILVEGFKHEAFCKLELHRPSLGHPLMCIDDSDIIAVATDDALDDNLPISRLDLNDVDRILKFVTDYVETT